MLMIDLAVLRQSGNVTTVGQTDRQTDRQTALPCSHTARLHSIRAAVKHCHVSRVFFKFDDY